MCLNKNYTVVLVALLASMSSILRSEIIFSEPIGMVTVTLKAGSDTRFSVPMLRTPVYTGEIKSVNQVSNVIELVGASWANGQFVFEDVDNPDPNATYFAVVTSGTQNGAQYKVVSNAASTLSIDPGQNSLAGLLTADVNGAGDTIKIYPYPTLASVFGGTALPDQTLVFEYNNSDSSIMKSSQVIYTYYESVDTWVNGITGSAADYTALLKVGEGYVVRLPDGGADVQLNMPGVVPMFNDRKVLISDAGSPNDITFALSVPVSVAIGDTNLGIQDQVQVFVYDNEVAALRKSASNILTYYADFGLWVDGLSGQSVGNTFFFEPGNAYVLRKPATDVAEVVETSFIPNYLNQ